ncbi:MAG: hypothetical protein QNJ91_15375 [Gammaproteobacteria bacterium]|nr:hypothetical protein [Gammaproteobacteria bacterium]
MQASGDNEQHGVMNMKMQQLAAALYLVFAAGVAHAGGDADPPPSFEPDALDRDAIIELVSDTTTQCRKEKDGSLCANYFTDDGVIKRLMYDDGARRDGRWFIDDQARLCILWDGKIKPLCFLIFAQDDGSYNLIKNDRHITTILGTEDGNTRGL